MSPRNGFVATLPRPQMSLPHRPPKRRKRTAGERLERVKQELVRAQREGPSFEETKQLLARLTDILTS